MTRGILWRPTRCDRRGRSTFTPNRGVAVPSTCIWRSTSTRKCCSDSGRGLDEISDEFEEPEDEFHLDLFFNWAVPALLNPPDLLVLATDLAGLGGVSLAVEVSAIDSYAAVTDAPERRLTLTGKSSVSLVDVMMGREQLCDVLDRSREVSEYLVEQAEGWMESAS